jgi:hypothetical protein
MHIERIAKLETRVVTERSAEQPARTTVQVAALANHTPAARSQKAYFAATCRIRGSYAAVTVLLGPYVPCPGAFSIGHFNFPPFYLAGEGGT